MEASVVDAFQIDLALTRWINGPAGHHPFIDAVLVGTTEVTVPLMVLAVVVRWFASVERKSERTLAVETGLTFVVGLLLNQAILLFVSRIRPYDAGVTHLIIAPSTDASFPSDHATAAVAIVAALLLNRHPRRAALFAAPAAFVILSRVYVGTHYVSDVIGGAGTAVAAALLIKATAGIRAPITTRIIQFL